MSAASPNSAPARSSSNPTAPPVDGRLHFLLVDPLLRLPDQAGSTRTFDLARRTAQAGHRVTVLTTTAGLRGDSAVIDGVTVLAKTSGIHARYGFAPPREIGEAFARALAWRLWSIKDADALLVTDRPLSPFLLLGWYCWLRGIPLLLDAREGPPPKPAPGAPLGKWLAMWTARAAFRLAAGLAKRIFVTSPDLEKNLASLAIGRGRVTLAAPGCDTVLFAAQPGQNTPAFSPYPYLAQRPLLTYAGIMNTGARLERVLDLASAAQTVAPDLIFALCGDGPVRGPLEARAVELGVLNKNVWFLEPLARRDLPPLLGATGAVIIAASDFAGENAGDSAPFYDALAAGKPVVAVTSGWLREAVEGRGAGLGLPDDTAAAVRELEDYLKDTDGLRRAGQQASALAAGRFNLDRTAATIRAAIEEIVAADPREAVLRRRTLRTKRVFDVLVSGAMLLVLSPFLIGLSIVVAFKMGWPVLFTQDRPGLKGRGFRIYKFRTMNSKKDSSGALLPDGERLTPFGKFMRRFSLDELPQLINILKGDMSLIGPRPLLHEYMPYYTPAQHRRHEVRPGVTGWAQVNGRNAISWEDKFALDVWYVDHVGFWLDMKILLMTAWTVLTGRGVSQEGHATFERFDQIMARKQGAEDV